MLEDVVSNSVSKWLKNIKKNPLYGYKRINNIMVIYGYKRIIES